MARMIDIFEVKVGYNEFWNFINNYPGELFYEGRGMGGRYLEKSTRLEVGCWQHGFLTDQFTLFKFKK